MGVAREGRDPVAGLRCPARAAPRAGARCARRCRPTCGGSTARRTRPVTTARGAACRRRRSRTSSIVSGTSCMSPRIGATVYSPSSRDSFARRCSSTSTPSIAGPTSTWSRSPRRGCAPTREATNDPVAAAHAGAAAAPVFAIVGVWKPLQAASRTVAPDEARPFVVHGEQDIVIHHPIEPGMELHSRAAPIGVHVKESGTTVVLKTETRDGDGRLLNEQYVTEFFRGITGGEGAGETPPERPRRGRGRARRRADVPGRRGPDPALRRGLGRPQRLPPRRRGRARGRAAGDHRPRPVPDGLRRPGGARVPGRRGPRRRAPLRRALLPADGARATA